MFGSTTKFCRKFFWVNKILVGNFFGSKKFWSEILWGQKMLGNKKLWVKKIWGQQKFWSEICLGQQKKLGQKNCGSTKIWSEIFLGKFFFVGSFCVRHPCWRTKRSWPLFSPTFSFFLFLRLLLFTHFGETPMAEINFPPIIWHN